MLLCLGEVYFYFFCDVVLHFSFDLRFVVVLHLLMFFILLSLFFTFSFRRHASPIRGLSPRFNTHFILSAQPITEWFVTLSFFNHSINLFAASTTTLSGHFLPTGVFHFTVRHRHFNLHLSRLPWEPAVLPWGLQGFILILGTHTSYSKRFSFKFYHILSWIACGESLSALFICKNLSAPYSFRTLFACSKSYVKTIKNILNKARHVLLQWISKLHLSIIENNMRCF